MKIKKIVFSIFIGTPFLASCNILETKTPLTGKRENLLSVDKSFKAERGMNSASVSTSPSIANKDWPVTGGNLNHALPVLSAPSKPKEMWKTNIGTGNSSGKRLISNLIITDDKIFGMDTQGRVTAVNKKIGMPIWSVMTSPEDRSKDSLGGGVAYGEGKVFVATSFGDVIALEANSGKELWRQALITPMRIAPVTTNGRVFVVTINNELHALNTKNGNILWTHVGLPETTGLLGGGVPAIENNLIVAPYSSGELYALRVENGYPVWTDTLNPTISTDSLSGISHIRARPIIFQGTLYAVSHGGRMAAIDVNSGIRLWQKDISGVRTPAIIGDYLYLLSINNQLICLDRHKGEIVWVTTLPMSEGKKKTNWAGPVATSSGLLLNSSNGLMNFYSSKDGSLLSSIETRQEYSLSPVIVDKKIYTLNDSADITAWR